MANLANQKELRRLSRARIKTVKTLIKGKDWDAAAYMMGYVLELALKAAACRALHLKHYPANTNNKNIDGCFQSHKFDQLLVVSGLSDVFSIDAPEKVAANWSLFVQEYPGDWPAMRYNPEVITTIDEAKVNTLYDYLFRDGESIIKTITDKRRW